MSYGKKRIAGVDYDLTHLDPFDMVVHDRAGQEVCTARVTFGCHTFTREWRAGDPLDHRVVVGSETRCFCPDRYALSLGLPQMIREAGNGNAHFSQRQNFLIRKQVQGGPYAVFFGLARARKPGIAVAMFVDSAYVKAKLPPKLDAIGFAVLMGKVAKGQPIKRPKK
jgi:hypothetical protein